MHIDPLRRRRRKSASLLLSPLSGSARAAFTLARVWQDPYRAALQRKLADVQSSATYWHDKASQDAVFRPFSSSRDTTSIEESGFPSGVLLLQPQGQRAMDKS